MAKYEITGPSGEKFEITAPDDATEQQVMAFAQSQFGQEEQAPVEPEPMDKRGLVRQALQGMTFGASDELGAGMAAIPAAWGSGRPATRPTGKPTPTGTGPQYPEVYEEMHGALQEEREQFKEDSPGAALAAELAGGLTTGGVGAAKMAGAKLLSGLRPVAKGAVIGGTEGATYGALSGDPGERAEGAAIGGATGAIGAPIIQGATALGSKLLGPVVRGIKDRLVGSAGGDARKYLADVLAREGLGSIDDISGAVPPQARGMATLSDVSEGARGALEGVVSDVDNPAIRKMARETLGERNVQQQQRIFEALDEGLDIPADANFKQVVGALKQTRGEKAKPLYEKARAQGVEMTDYMKSVFENVPEVKRAMRKAEQNVSAKRAVGEKVSHIDVIDEMKRVLDDEIGTMLRQGKKNRARDIIQVKNRILQDVDKQVPSYREARNAYAGDSALLDAAEKGKDILRKDVDYLDDLVETMSDSEKQMFRIGAKKAIREKLMQAREGTNSVNRIASEINLERMRKAFPDEKAFSKFKDNLKFEASLFDTSRVLHNSMTALRQAAQRNMESGGSGVLDEVGHDTASIVAQGLRKLLNRGLSTEAKEELGTMLLTPLKDLPRDLRAKLDRTILSKLPAEQQAKAMRIIEAARTGATATTTALPAVAGPALQNAE